MNEDTFNLQIRKFLKKVGISSQREIEAAVRKAIESGKIAGDGKLHAILADVRHVDDCADVVKAAIERFRFSLGSPRTA